MSGFNQVLAEDESINRLVGPHPPNCFQALTLSLLPWHIDGLLEALARTM